MLFWKGWRSLSRNESRNNNGCGHTSKLYAVMWACGCIKEDKGRGRQTLGDHTSDPKSEMTFIYLLTGGSYKGIHSAPPKEDYRDYMISRPMKGGGCKALPAAVQGSSLPAWPTGNCWLQFTVHGSSHLLSKEVAVLPFSIFRLQDQRDLIHKNALYSSYSSPVNQRPLHHFVLFSLFLFCYFIFKVWLIKPNEQRNIKKPFPHYFRVCFLPAPLRHGWKPAATVGRQCDSTDLLHRFSLCPSPYHTSIYNINSWVPALKTSNKPTPYWNILPRLAVKMTRSLRHAEIDLSRESNLLHYAYSSWWDVMPNATLNTPV